MNFFTFTTTFIFIFKGWINFIDPYGWFHWYFRYWLGRRSLDDKRQIARWKEIVSRFKGKLVKIIKDANGRFDDYSISPEIRQILLHWGYEFVESDLFFVYIKMGYFWFNGQELLQKANGTYHICGSKGKAAEYYLENRGVLKKSKK